MDSELSKEFIDNLWDERIVPTLSEYIKIPAKSPSFDDNWNQNGYIRQAAEMIADAARKIPVKNAAIDVLQLEGRTPLIYIDIPATDSSDSTFLFYGHYDKQPEFEGWHDHLGPWKPVIQNDRLYGRGGADDGYAIFATLAAIAALDEQNVTRPRCVALIEGCEESGSFDLPYYLDHLADLVGKPDLLICLDAECGNYDQLWLTTSLRGMISSTLRVDVLKEGVHSGMAGGIVPSSFRLLRQLIDRIEDQQTGDVFRALTSEIPTHVKEEATLAAKTLGDGVVDRFPWHGTTHANSEDLTQLILQGTWGASLATVGLGGAPPTELAGNTLRPFSSAKLVFRLPPNVNAHQAAEELTQEMASNPPQGASVSFSVDAAETGWHAKPLNDKLTQLLNEASLTHFGKPMRRVGCGGTIPFMAMLGHRYPDCQCVVTGVLGPHSNAHGPNEFLDIPTGKKVTACMAEVVANLKVLP